MAIDQSKFSALRILLTGSRGAIEGKNTEIVQKNQELTNLENEYLGRQKQVINVMMTGHASMKLISWETPLDVYITQVSIVNGILYLIADPSVNTAGNISSADLYTIESFTQ